MSIENLYAILDTKANSYGALLTFKNDTTAIRAFTEELISCDAKSMLALYPADYVLFVLGHYNKDTGCIDAVVPQLIITGTEAVTRAIDEVNRRKKFREALQNGIADSVSASDDGSGSVVGPTVAIRDKVLSEK